jgi:phosphotriesterase-related protein
MVAELSSVRVAGAVALGVGRSLGEGRVVELLCELLSRGHADRTFLSQDVCHDSQLKRYEGNGYTYLAEVFLPRLRVDGVSDVEIETMTVANPRRLLTIG